MALNTFSSGVNTSFSSQLNSNFKNVSINSSVSTQDTTEYHVSTNAWATITGFSKTFTCPQGANNFLLGLKIVLDSKYVSAAGQLRGKLTNNTTGESIYLGVLSRAVYSGASDNSNILAFVNSGTYSTLTFYVGFPNGIENNILAGGGESFNHWLKATSNGATYTVIFEAQDDTNAGTATDLYIKNITLTAYWTYLGPATTEGWA